MKVLFFSIIFWSSHAFATVDAKRVTFTNWYSKKIHYVPFHSIKWAEENNDFDLSDFPIPQQLQEKINSITILSYEDEKIFQNWLKAKLSSQNITTQDIADMSPKDAVDWAINLAASSMKYQDVDTDKSSPIYVRCLVIGKGECDKYADALIKIFHWMKTYNSRLKNIYITRQEYGGNYLPHVWNTIIQFSEAGVQVSQIDLTRKTQGKSIEAVPGKHFPINENLFLAAFYYGADEYQSSLESYKKAELLGPSLPNDKRPMFEKFILSQKTYLACQLADKNQYSLFSNQMKAYGIGLNDDMGLCQQLLKDESAVSSTKLFFNQIQSQGVDTTKTVVSNLENQLSSLRRKIFERQQFMLSLAFSQSLFNTPAL